MEHMMNQPTLGEKPAIFRQPHTDPDVSDWFQSTKTRRHWDFLQEISWLQISTEDFPNRIWRVCDFIGERHLRCQFTNR